MYRIHLIIYRRLVLEYSQSILSEYYSELGKRLRIGEVYMRIWSQRAKEKVAMQPQLGWIAAVVGLCGLLRETGIEEQDHLVGLLVHLHKDGQIRAIVALDTLDLRLDLYHGTLYFIDYFFVISLYT